MAPFKKLKRSKQDDDSTTTSEETKPKRSKKPRVQGLSVGMLVAVAFVASVVTLGGLAVLINGHIVTLQAQAQASTAQAEARGRAARLAGELGAYADVVARAGAAASAADATARNERLRASLAGALPALAQLRVYTAPELAVDATTPEGLGYAGLDAARAALEGKVPVIEAAAAGKPGQRIMIVRGLEATGQAPAGVLVAELAMDWVKERLRPLVPAGGYLELRQGGGSQHLLLANAGNSGLQGRAPTAEVPVAGTAWSVAYWSGGGAAAAMAPTSVWIAFGIAAVILGLIAAVLGFVLARLVKDDLVKLAKFAVDLMKGKREHAFQVKLVEFKKVVLALERHIESARSRSVGESRRERMTAKYGGGSEGPSSAMFLDSGAFSVEELDEGPDGGKGQ